MNNKSPREVLEQAFLHATAFSNSRYLSDKDINGIKSIILGNHLTFRYMLMTALLAKNANPTCHMRSLQAQATLKGAYDARSLCHFVIVPFERERLDLRLGGSNEPFLNKPARFPAIEKTNAVRAGNDQQLLIMLYDLLERLNTASPEAIYESLVFALALTLTRAPKLSSIVSTESILCSQDRVNEIIQSIISVNSGGESAVIVTGAIFRTLYSSEVTVKVSPVNQAGSSSRGVGDIDLIYKKHPFCVIEVKDKLFSAYDVQHAMRMAIESFVNRLIFMVGPSVPDSSLPDLNSMTKAAANSGFDLSFAFVSPFCFSMIAYFDQSKRQQFLSYVPIIVDEIRASDQTRDHICSVFTSVEPH